MTKLIMPGFITLCLLTISAHADTATGATDSFDHKPELGIGIGAVIGGLIAGPPGAILGMAGGAWLGGNDEKKDNTISGLNAELIQKQTDVSLMETRFSQLQQQYGTELQKVAARNHASSLEQLSQGVSFAVYFRTNSAEIDAETRPRIEKLAEFLNQYPAVRLLVEGYADRRGSSEINRELGNKRARAVEATLLQKGIDNKRILTHSYGESKARAIETDLDGTVFDRRVTITLTLDTQL